MSIELTEDTIKKIQQAEDAEKAAEKRKSELLKVPGGLKVPDPKRPSLGASLGISGLNSNMRKLEGGAKVSIGNVTLQSKNEGITPPSPMIDFKSELKLQQLTVNQAKPQFAQEAQPKPEEPKKQVKIGAFSSALGLMKALKSEEKKIVDEQKPNFVLDSSRPGAPEEAETPQNRP